MVDATSEHDSSGTLVWHEDVHYRFQESLHYYLFAIQGFKLTTLKEIEGAMQRMKIPGYCLYETYGPFDVLLRVWLNVESRPILEDWLRNTPYIGDYAPFHVEAQDNWIKKISNITSDDIREAVEQLSPSDIIDAQHGNQDAVQRVRQSKLAATEETSSKNTVKFFTCVVPQSVVADDSIAYAREQLIQALEMGKTPILQGSVYTGMGFARLLLKGRITFDNYYVFQNFILNRSAQLARVGLRLHTLFAVNWKSPEYDHVAESSMKLAAIVDTEAALWIPELYHPSVSTLLRDEVYGYILQKNYCHAWNPEDRQRVRELLAARLFADQERSVQLLAEWFIRTERELREWQGRLYHALDITDVEEKAFRDKIRGKEDPAIGTLFRLIVEALNAKVSTQAKEILPKDFSEHSKLISTLRNHIMHGKLESAFSGASWMKWISILSDFLPIFQRFRLLVMELIAQADNVDH